MCLQVWDLRQTEVAYTLSGHMDTVTGLSVSPNGHYLLSNGMDDTGMHPPSLSYPRVVGISLEVLANSTVG